MQIVDSNFGLCTSTRLSDPWCDLMHFAIYLFVIEIEFHTLAAAIGVGDVGSIGARPVSVSICRCLRLLLLRCSVISNTMFTLKLIDTFSLVISNSHTKVSVRAGPFQVLDQETHANCERNRLFAKRKQIFRTHTHGRQATHTHTVDATMVRPSIKMPYNFRMKYVFLSFCG